MKVKDMLYLPKFRVFVSDKCQLNCRFCGGMKNGMESFEPHDISHVINDDILVKIIVAYRNNGGRDVQLTGGEPLLKDNIVDFCQRLTSLGIRVEINTNGIALTSSMASQLVEAGIHDIKISLPGFTEEEYKNVTGHDYFVRVTENIRSISNIMNVRINTVATRSSIENLDMILDYCKKNGINSIAFLELCYYPNLITKEYFKNEHIDFLTVVGPVLEERFATVTGKLDFRDDFKTPVYFWKDSKTGFVVSYKCAKPVFRCEACKQCKDFCQEGLYQLRLSSGGYLSFCNYPGALGVDLNPFFDDQEKLDSIFHEKYEVWSNVFQGDPEEFYQKEGLID